MICTTRRIAALIAAITLPFLLVVLLSPMEAPALSVQNACHAEVTGSDTDHATQGCRYSPTDICTGCPNQTNCTHDGTVTPGTCPDGQGVQYVYHCADGGQITLTIDYDGGCCANCDQGAP